MKEQSTLKRSMGSGILNWIEAVCDKLPPPGVIFFILFFITAVLSAVLSLVGIAVVNPASGDVVMVQNFFTRDGLYWLLETMVDNFATFYPLGMVITITIAVGVCDEAGLFSAAIRSALRNVPTVIVPLVVAFIGCCGNIASDCCNIVLMPLAAAIYLSVGRHPIVGMIVALAGCEAGFACNVMLTGSDAIATSLTNAAIQGFLPETDFVVDVSSNFYFTFASTFVAALTIAVVADKLVEKRFGPYVAPVGIAVTEPKKGLEPEESKALKVTLLSLIAFFGLLVAAYFLVPLASVQEDGSRSLMGSPFLNGLIPIMFLLFMTIGVVYGTAVGKFRKLSDVEAAVTKQMSTMGSYLTFCFFCGQFNALFSWTKIGTVISISGAKLLQNIGLSGVPLMLIFIVIVCVTNIFMPSASAKWAILGPVFVPMLMLMGMHPAFTQMIYRLGDSPCNIITPMNPYVWLLLDMARRDYDPKIKMGKIISGLLPISVILLIVWVVFFFAWNALGIPIGPGITQMLPAGIL